MTNVRCSLFVFALAFTSVTLVACSSDDTAGPSARSASTAAQPLVEACSGSFTCRDSDGTVEEAFTLATKDGACTTTQGDVFLANGDWLTMKDGKLMRFGRWKGDSHAFQACDSVTCFDCANDAVASSPDGASARCSGRTSCDDYGAGDCGTHQGCTLHGHAVYSNGMFDHYEDECQGSTPSCSSHDTEEECTRQDCTWK